MAPVQSLSISEEEKNKVLILEEGHFCDLKAVEIKPAKLTKTISAFSNADGGELYIGIDEDKSTGTRSWRGFESQEDANGFLQIFEELFPLGAEYSYDFLSAVAGQGYVLKVDVQKTKDIKAASNGEVYLRRGAQNLPVSDETNLSRLRLNKGLASHESETVSVYPEIITESDVANFFIVNVVPHTEAYPWMRKQLLVVEEKPTIAGIVLFADEPQAVLPKYCGIKVYRYKTSESKGTRETMDFDPISIEGCAYSQIQAAVKETQKIVESLKIRTPSELESVKYPPEAIHEIITNSVLHRDYSIADDIHIIIFDNRVEVLSPGTLPGHITPENILEERFARNGGIVRIINKFPNPPNKDIGEGLNTVFQAMQKMKLKNPEIKQSGGYVKVILRHEPLASPEKIILKYLTSHPQIRNREAREICFIYSENKMKRILQRMVKDGLIESIPGRTRATAAYRLIKHKDISKEFVQQNLL